MGKLKERKTLISIILVAGLIVAYIGGIYIKTAEQESIFNQDSCILEATTYLEGEWELVAYEDYNTKLAIYPSGDFTLTDFSESGSIVKGRWSYDKAQKAITFDFDKLDSFWLEILSNPKLTEESWAQDVVGFDLTNKSITVKVGYERRKVFTGCEAQRYYISILNRYLYKKM